MRRSPSHFKLIQSTKPRPTKGSLPSQSRHTQLPSPSRLTPSTAQPLLSTALSALEPVIPRPLPPTSSLAQLGLTRSEVSSSLPVLPLLSFRHRIIPASAYEGRALLVQTNCMTTTCHFIFLYIVHDTLSSFDLWAGD
ncbi:hypothetical protein DL98DRAFT_265559 [Cadophora sp. DSE1049]|nr:hypothetical protein DL98DRAFT_265559 [Cadophora sp. DSE1049]